jgi:hypothetical protein
VNIPTIPIPPNVRFGLYVVYAIGSAIATYLAAKSIVGEAEIALWTALGAILTAIAASNVSDPYQPRHRDEGGYAALPFGLVGLVVIVVLVVILL